MYLKIIKVKFEFVLCRKASVAQRAALILPFFIIPFFLARTTLFYLLSHLFSVFLFETSCYIQSFRNLCKEFYASNIQLCFVFDKGDYGVNNFFPITAK